MQRYGKWDLQNRQYAFPYHHTPHFDGAGPRSTRALGWGLEYLCYLQHVVGLIRELRPATLLDVGCGDGRLISELDFVARCKGVDLSPEAVAFARAFAPFAEFCVQDVAEVTGEFDVVTAIEVLEHVPDEELSGFLSALAAKVRPGGHFLISVPTTVRPLHRKHYRHYTAAVLQQSLAQAMPDWRLTDQQFVFADTLLTRLHRKATDNQFFAVHIPAFNRFVWRRAWEGRLTSEARGAHLVALLQKPA